METGNVPGNEVEENKQVACLDISGVYAIQQLIQ